MPKGYWVTIYRSIKDPDKLAAYAKLAPPAVAPFGGRYLVRGTADVAYEAGLKERIVDLRIPERRAGGRRLQQPGLSGCAEGAGRRRGARPAHRRGTGVAASAPPYCDGACRRSRRDKLRLICRRL